MRRFVALILSVVALTSALAGAAATASASDGPQPTAVCCRH